MEKKIKKTSELEKSGSYSGEEKTIIITIIIALVIIGVLLVNVVIMAVPEEKFSVIYYLDSEKRLENIPEIVILGQNSTFSLWVGVENQNATSSKYIVEVKIDNGTAPIGNSSVESNIPGSGFAGCQIQTCVPVPGTIVHIPPPVWANRFPGIHPTPLQPVDIHILWKRQRYPTL